MREILFSGKRTNNGGWVEGYLVKLGRESFSDPERYGICNKAIPLGGSGVCYNLKIDEVIPETVGQFTGLTDKNGKKVFEGDIVKNEYRKGQYQYFKIVYDTRFYCWRVENKYGILGFLYNVIGDLEVIGNIHDHPELLKGGEE